MEKIIALHRHYSGEIISFQTSAGRIISYRKAIKEVENGLIEDVEIDLDVNGDMFIYPTTDATFDEFPQFY